MPMSDGLQYGWAPIPLRHWVVEHWRPDTEWQSASPYATLVQALAWALHSKRVFPRVRIRNTRCVTQDWLIL